MHLHTHTHTQGQFCVANMPIFMLSDMKRNRKPGGNRHKRMKNVSLNQGCWGSKNILNYKKNYQQNPLE